MSILSLALVLVSGSTHTLLLQLSGSHPGGRKKVLIEVASVKLYMLIGYIYLFYIYVFAYSIW